MVIDILDLIFTLVLVALVFAALTSPFESLSWWAGWMGDETGEEDDEIEEEVEVLDDQTAEITPYKQFVVYLTGIAGISGEEYLPEERAFLDTLKEKLDNAYLVDDIYPYSVTNQALTGQRVLSGFWKWVARKKLEGGRAGMLVNLRNVLQVLVSADSRYGPMFSYGTASIIIKALNRHGYPFGSGIPVTLIGYSGGGQMSISSIKPLTVAIRAPVRVISLGGVMSSARSLNAVEHLYHLCGDKDGVQRIGPILFPGRWKVARFSVWNRLKRARMITIVPMGETVGHNGAGGYLDDQTTFPDGVTYFDFTVAKVSSLINDPPHLKNMLQIEPEAS